MIMRNRARIAIVTLVGCACLVGAALALASESFTTTTYFTPDKLGAPTNLSATAVFSSDGLAPTPIGNVLAYGPAGLEVDVAGAGVCKKATLEADGPSGCPADARIGFGGGIGLVEIAKEILKEPFTLDFFLGPKEHGHLAILAYANAVSPVSAQVVVDAKEVHGPAPYGLGFTFEIPPIATLPGAAYASLESAYFTIGSQKVAYYKTVHGKQKLVHVKGVIVPKSCPRGGFPFRVTIGFLDGTQSVDAYTSPCPRR
jgi:hypothetical protein